MKTISSDIIREGMECLVERFGIVGAERFVSTVLREKFDYTEWQREYFDRKTAEEIDHEAIEASLRHPFTGSALLPRREKERNAVDTGREEDTQ